MCCLASFTEAAAQIKLEPVFSREEPIIVEDDIVPERHMEAKNDMIGFFPSGDRFT